MRINPRFALLFIRKVFVKLNMLDTYLPPLLLHLERLITDDFQRAGKWMDICKMCKNLFLTTRTTTF